MDRPTAHNGTARHDTPIGATCRCDELREQVVALGTAIEHALDVVEACLEVLPEHDTRVDRHVDEARTQLGLIW